MKKWLFLIAVMYGSAVLAFETHKPVDCFGTAEVLNLLKSEFQETIFFDSVNNITGKSRVALFINHDTGTWTMVEYDDNNACILAAGRSRSAKGKSI